VATIRAFDRALSDLRSRFPRAIIDGYRGELPSVEPGVLVAPGAVLAGAVVLAQDASVWYGCVLRGDLAPVRIGARTNVQDGTVIHVADDGPCILGAEVVVGHRAVLHACRVEDGCLIGMQATVLDGAVIGQGSIVGAGALVTARTIVPPRSLVLGTPARVVKTLTLADEESTRALAHKYVRVKQKYLDDSIANASGRTE
jgi:carbonic anhydrase/acetyltransferase-like protein (isoleucine patch superfamily)